ncbi:MAG TPA: aldo/keto reductase [Terriglobia bacterium]|nr:aldo/keto reductase [Terriglobia bacterium]
MRQRTEKMPASFNQQLIPGFATPEGTARYRDRFANQRPSHFRNARGLWLSSIGLGTYLGEPTQEFDALYREAVTRALEMGTNVIDSAVNYRHQRSERAIGTALAAMISLGSVRRDEVFLATKGGFLTFDGEEPDDPAAYFEQNLVRTGLIEPKDVAANCHVMAPRYIENQVEVSRRNLGVETVDLYYVHNPETQLRAVPRPEFYRRLTAAFAALEHAAAAGKIRAYGVATWDAFRVAPSSRDSINLLEVVHAAESAGGRNHHFQAIQLPFNLAMLEALTAQTQRLDGALAPALRTARTYGITTFASGSILQGQLSQGMPDDLRNRFDGLATDAQRAIQFVRSTPGVTCALVGMSHKKHVEENLATAGVAPLSPERYRALFGA